MKAIDKAIEGVLAPVPPRPVDVRPEPAHRDKIAMWLVKLAKTRMRGKPETDAALSEEVLLIVETLGDLPADCWSEQTLKQARISMKWWPGPADLSEFLKPVADDARSRYRIASAPLLLPAHESAVPYQPGPPPVPTRPPRLRYAPPPPGGIDPLTKEEIATQAEAERARDRQLAVFGLTVEQGAACAAVTAAKRQRALMAQRKPEAAS